ncbi:hypothetical protein RRG08_013210 [Elysia crispata]|uniref:Uncharacterized protein n=1 Tax=Elysia crispata TaxID=231223 RepID=A0AAE1B579_9GAST|nr:hypothetical protein RRG08_013210 [Elysia crispata]
MITCLLKIAVVLSVEALPVSWGSPTTSSPLPSEDTKCSRLQPRDKCWRDQGIELTQPPANGSGASTAPLEGQQTQAYVNVIIAENTGEHCQRQAKFKAALECAMNSMVSCMPIDYRSYIPQPGRMGALVDKLCENTTEINFSCAQRMMHGVQKCRLKKFIEAFGTSKETSTVEITCKNFRFTTECLGAELRPCGCATVRLYETLSRDFLYPPACPGPATNRRPAVCDVRNEALFTQNGSGVPSNPALLWSLISVSYVSRWNTPLLHFPIQIDLFSKNKPNKQNVNKKLREPDYLVLVETQIAAASQGRKTTS